MLRHSVQKPTRTTVAAVDDIPIAAYEVVKKVEVFALLQENPLHVALTVACDVSENTIVSNVCHIVAIYGVLVEEIIEEQESIFIKEKSVNLVIV